MSKSNTLPLTSSVVLHCKDGQSTTPAHYKHFCLIWSNNFLFGNEVGHTGNFLCPGRTHLFVVDGFEEITPSGFFSSHLPQLQTCLPGNAHLRTNVSDLVVRLVRTFAGVNIGGWIRIIFIEGIFQGSDPLPRKPSVRRITGIICSIAYLPA